MWEGEGLWLFRPQFSTQLPSRVPSGVFQYGALLSGDDSLFMGTFGKDLTQAEGSCVSCAIQALPMAREQVPAQTDCYFGLGLSVNSLRNLMFWVFCCACNWTSWLFSKNMKSDSPGINRAWFSVTPVSWLIYFLI